jgi:hypothetical protein
MQSFSRGAWQRNQEYSTNYYTSFESGLIKDPWHCATPEVKKKKLAAVLRGLIFSPRLNEVQGELSERPDDETQFNTV